MDTDNNLATLEIIIHFPLPDFLEELRDFRDLVLWDLVFWVPLLDLNTTSKLHIITCNFKPLEKNPTLSLAKDCRKLSLISPTDTDSIAPCKLSSRNKDSKTV